jgi:hypothetical protein
MPRQPIPGVEAGSGALAHGRGSDKGFSLLPRFADDMATALARLRTHPRIDAQRVMLLGHVVGTVAVRPRVPRIVDFRAAQLAHCAA